MAKESGETLPKVPLAPVMEGKNLLGVEEPELGHIPQERLVPHLEPEGVVCLAPLEFLEMGGWHGSQSPLYPSSTPSIEAFPSFAPSFLEEKSTPDEHRKTTKGRRGKAEIHGATNKGEERSEVGVRNFCEEGRKAERACGFPDSAAHHFEGTRVTG